MVCSCQFCLTARRSRIALPFADRKRSGRARRWRQGDARLRCRNFRFERVANENAWRLSRDYWQAARTVRENSISWSSRRSEHGSDSLTTRSSVGFDFVVSLIALIVLSPVLLTVALIAKISSPGPILYRVCASGCAVHSFNICKSRTMVIERGEARRIGNRRRRSAHHADRHGSCAAISSLSANYRNSSTRFFGRLAGLVRPRPEISKNTSRCTTTKSARFSTYAAWHHGLGVDLEFERSRRSRRQQRSYNGLRRIDSADETQRSIVSTRGITRWGSDDKDLSVTRFASCCFRTGHRANSCPTARCGFTRWCRKSQRSRRTNFEKWGDSNIADSPRVVPPVDRLR